MGESENHKKLKELAWIVLMQRGYKFDEIQEEYRVNMPNTKKTVGYIVDVVGINNINKTAVELGECDPKKLTHLELYFDDVIHIPYGIEQSSEINLSELIGLKNINNDLKTEIESLEKNVEELEKTISMGKEKTEWEIKKESISGLLMCIRMGVIEGDSLWHAVSLSQRLYHQKEGRGFYSGNIVIEGVFKVLFGVNEIN